MTGRWRRARVVASAGVLVAGAWGAGSAQRTDDAPASGEASVQIPAAEQPGTNP